MSFTWQNGRQLAAIMQNGTTMATYSYNADGLRTSKVVNGVTTSYYRMNGTIYAQKTGDEYLYFLYDENGIAYGFILKKETVEQTYYYEFNLQGDIIGVEDNTGKKKYYSDKGNYITEEAIVDNIIFDSENNNIYFGLSQIDESYQDNTFKIEGENVNIVIDNKIFEKV